MARRLQTEGNEDNDEKIIWRAFLLTAGRKPNEVEQAACAEFCEKQRKVYSNEMDGEFRALTDLCQLLLASNLFLYIE